MKPCFAFPLLAALVTSATAFSAPTTFSAPAPSRQIQCHSTGVADAGYELRVEPSQRRAVLSAISFIDTRPIARLSCVPVLQGPPRPDVPRNFLLCTGVARGFGSLAVRLFTPGFTGVETASVRMLTRVGRRLVERQVRFGNLLCGR